MAKTFNWSELDRQTLFDVMYLAREKVVDRKLSIKQFHDIIVRHVKSFLPIKAKRVHDPIVAKGRVYIGGAYYSDHDEDRLNSIEVCLAYNKTDKNIQVTAKRFSFLCIGFADTILHEVIHMHQYRKRKFKSLPDYASTAQRTKQRQEQEYLGNSDEVDAYAFNIACELWDKFDGDEDQMIDYLNENQKGTNRRHNCWRMYLKAFGHDHSHPILKKLKKRVIFYMPKLAYGKPFRSQDWINR